nr:PREDICTED: WD repeat-containing protein 49 isoform X2 [Lepisosteus oculatus]
MATLVPDKMDTREKKETEFIENRLSMKDFLKMQMLFLLPDLKEPVCVIREVFVDKASSLVGRGTKDEYGELFDKIDVTREGFITWDKLTSFLLLELYERDEHTKTSVVPQWKDIKLLPTAHKEPIQKIAYLRSSSRYLTISREGLLGIWTDSLTTQKTIRIATDSVKLKDLWVTSLALLPNVNKIAVGFTSKEICFYDLLSKQEFSCQYKIQDLEQTPISMDYWYNPGDADEAVLSFGDVGGEVNGICFTTAQISLFERPTNTADPDSVIIIKWPELVSGCHRSCYIVRHRAHRSSWVRRVKYLGNLEAFISCTTGAVNSVVLAWKENEGAPLRTTIFHISKGINDFDYHAGMNLIATAGIDNKVCLWNPYVISKPTGVLQGHMASVIAVQFIIAKKQLLSFSKDKVLRVWDVHHQLCIQRVAGIFPKCVDFHMVLYFDEEHGKLLTTFNNQITLLEIKQETGQRVTSHAKPVSCVLYNPVFKQVISSDADSTVTCWMIDTGQKIKQFTRCHGNAEISAMALDATGTRLFTGATDGMVKVWDFNGHCHHKLSAGLDQAVEISQILVLKRTVLVLGWERMITVFRLNSLTQFFVKPAEWKGGLQHQDDILCAAFLPPQTLVSGSYDGEIIIWNNNTENALRKLHPGGKRNFKFNSDSALSKLGNRSRSSSTHSGKRTRSLVLTETETECNYNITRLIFLEARKNVAAGDGANLVSCGGSGTVRFWNTVKSCLVAEFIAHKDVGSIIMSIDKSSQYLFTGDVDGWVKVWDIQEYGLHSSDNVINQPPALLTRFQPHVDCVSHLETCVHNGQLLLISASADCSVVVSYINGSIVGIFGQDQKEQHEDEKSNAGSEETSSEKNSEDLEDGSLDQSMDTELDVMEHPILSNPWQNTILGKRFQECRGLKESDHRLSPYEEMRSSIGTFSSLRVGELSRVEKIEKPDFVINPHRYFGEKGHEKTLQPPDILVVSERDSGTRTKSQAIPRATGGHTPQETQQRAKQETQSEFFISVEALKSANGMSKQSSSAERGVARPKKHPVGNLRRSLKPQVLKGKSSQAHRKVSLGITGSS